MRIAIIWFSLLSFWQLQAQAILYSGSESALPINRYIHVYATADTLSAGEAYFKIQQGELKRVEAQTTPGFSTDIFWIHFTLNNPEHKVLLLELDNPHIDFVNFYKIQGGIRKVGIGGDRITFKDRTIINRNFIFPLSTSVQSEYLLQLDKRFAAMSYPLKIWDSDDFYEQESKDQILLGVFFGVLAFIGLSSLMAGIGLSDRLFTHYSLYVIFISLYLFTNQGLAFQYIYPDSSELNGYARVILAVISSIFSTLFFSNFLNVEGYLPKINRVFRGVVLFMGFAIVCWFVLKVYFESYFLFTIPLLNLFYFLQVLLIFLLIWVLIATYKRQPQTVLVFSFAFSAVLGGTIVYILIEYGAVSQLNFPINPIMIGSILEVFIFSGSMIYRLKQINDARNRLALEIRTQQKELISAFVKGGERERNRISGELHDHIGSQLALIKLKMQRGKYDAEEIGDEISKVCDDVRQLSHQLIPHEMEIAGFYNTCKGHSKKFSQATGIRVTIDQYSFPKLSQDLSMHLFRVIEESLHNVKKHAKATEVEIQLFGYGHELVLTIEDDGVGFDRKKTQLGYGIRGMRSRVEAFGGTLEITSVLNKGTNIVIHIPHGQGFVV